MTQAKWMNDLKFLLGFFVCLSTAQHNVLENFLPINDGEHGHIQGSWRKTHTDEDYIAYEGIPYAEPPTGSLRFEAPRVYEKWPAPGLTLLADAIGYSCPQWDPVHNEVKGQEDCLFLNVYVPDRHRSDFKPLPVIFFIHGPDFQSGSGGMYSPKVLLDSDVILVTINYRLGVLGFMSTEDGGGPGNTAPAGNNGLKDQVFALHWVKAHISNFGGDPNDVTLIGHGAGGASVHYHYLSQRSEGLFKQGISMSGTALAPWALTENSLQKARQVAASLNCNRRRTGVLTNCLRFNVSATDIVTAGHKLQEYLHTPWAPFGPVVEKQNPDEFIIESPIDTILSGKALDLPWITGVVESEGLAIIAGMLANNTELKRLDDRWKFIAPVMLDFNFTMPLWKQTRASRWIREQYLDKNYFNKVSAYPIANMVGDRMFVGDAVLAARLHAKMGKSPVRFYRFEYRGLHSLSEVASGTYRNFGVAHGDDVAYILDLPIHFSLNQKDADMRDKLVRFWVTYAQSSNGTPSFDADWPPLPNNYEDEGYFLDIQNTNRIKANKLGDAGRRKFWLSLEIKEDNMYKDPFNPKRDAAHNFYYVNQFRPCNDTIVILHD